MDEIDEWMLSNTDIPKRITTPSAWLTILQCIRRCRKPVRLVTIDEARAQYKPCRHRACGLICKQMKTLQWHMPADAPSEFWNENLDYYLNARARLTQTDRSELMRRVRYNMPMVQDESEDSLMWCITQIK